MATLTCIAVTMVLPWQQPADAAAPCIRNSPASTAHATARAGQGIPASRPSGYCGMSDLRGRMRGK
jgi:hypothetical protein